MKLSICFSVLLFALTITHPASAQGCPDGDLTCYQRRITDATAQAQATRYQSQLQATRQAIELQAAAQATYDAQAISADATRRANEQAISATSEAESVARSAQSTRQAIEAQATQAAYAVQIAEVQKRSEFGTLLLYVAGALAVAVMCGFAARLFWRKPVKVLRIEASEIIDVPQPPLLTGPVAPQVPQVKIIECDEDGLQFQILGQWK